MSKEYIRNLRDPKISIFTSGWEPYVCSSLFTTRHCLHSEGFGMIHEYPEYGTLEGSKTSFEIFT